MPTNDSQAFRTDEAVDISSTADVGYYVGWTSAGEYLRYTVNVDEAGEKKPKPSSYVGSPLGELVSSSSGPSLRKGAIFPLRSMLPDFCQ